VGESSAGQPGARSARDERHLGSGAQADHSNYLISACRQHRSQRDLPVLPQTVRVIDRKRVRVADNVVISTDSTQTRQQLFSLHSLVGYLTCPQEVSF
jgi:hypothetical protein